MGDASVEDGDRNEVRLRGRVTTAPERRSLPSGDEVVVLRVTVRRAGGGADTVTVVVGPGPAAGARPRPGQVGRRRLGATAALAVGTRVELAGELRRRWWDAGGARRSLVEVHAHELEPLTSPE